MPCSASSEFTENNVQRESAGIIETRYAKGQIISVHPDENA